MKKGDKFKSIYAGQHVEVTVKDIEERNGYLIVRERVKILDENVTESEAAAYKNEENFIEEKEVKKKWYQFWK